MKKRIFSLLLCIVLCLSLMPTVAFAEPDAELVAITNVAVTGMPMPAVGDPIATSGITITTDPANAYTVDGIYWWNVTLDEEATGTFEADNKYELCVVLLPKKDFYFGFESAFPNEYIGEATINGLEPRFSFEAGYPKGALYLSSMLVPFDSITKVEVSGVPTPKAGQSCAVDTIQIVTEPEDVLESSNIYWYDFTAGRKSAPTDTFIENHYYHLAVELLPKVGYVFDFDTDDNYTGTATINDSAAYIKESLGSSENGLYLATENVEIPATAYDVWVGGKRVTSANKDNIFGDTGTPTATYDPITKTLTLNGATLSGMYKDSLIYSDGIDLTINAPAGLTLNNSIGNGVYSSVGSITINGDVTGSVAEYALYADNALTVAGDIDLTHTGSEGIPIYSGRDSVEIDGNAKFTALSETYYAIFADQFINVDGNVTMIVSDSGSFQNGLYASLGDVIVGGNVSGSVKQYALYSYNNLTVNGDADLTHTGSNGYPINSSKGSVEIKGNATIATTTYSTTAIHASKSITIGKNLTVAGMGKGSFEYGLHSFGIAMVSGKWDIMADIAAIYALGDGFTIPTTHEITLPEGGEINNASIGAATLCTVTESDGTTVSKHVVIEPKAIKYNIWGSGEWTKESPTGLAFTTDAPFAKFNGVRVDGLTIAATNYNIAEDPAKITLAPEYLETLNIGSHSIEIVFSDGSASANFTVKVAGQQSDPTNPKTGDNSHIFLWMALLLVSGGVLVGTIVYGKKRNRTE